MSTATPTAEPRRQRSLFGEILDWMLVPLLLVWPLSIGITFLVAQAVASRPFDNSLTQRANVLANLTAGDARFAAGLLPALQRADAELHQQPRLMQLRAADGSLIGGTADIPAPPDLRWAQRPGVHLRDALVDGRNMRVASRWVEPQAQRRHGPGVLVQVAESMGPRSALAREIMRGVILPQFVIVPISILLVWFGLGQGIVPLDELQARIRRRRPDDLSPIDQREAPEEIAPLVDSINGLLGRLENSIHTQKRFIADAAHQLKTPLAGLRMQSELAQREADPQELRASLRQIGLSVVRTTRLVNQLLTLARTENQGLTAVGTRLDLRLPVRDALQDIAPLAIGKGLELEFDAPAQPLWVRGNAMLLQELTKNLIDNAIVYTPRGGSVAVRLRARAQDWRIELAVEDTGIGIAPADRELVLQPFYRVLGTGQDGSGLGLSIVQEIARQHGAELELADNPASADAARPGLCARLSFAGVETDELPQPDAPPP
ncbi:sensor protein QseC [mine drainage metagenome]|uniref:histidine kinase n=1 Tax=mine drainage metagenome TaxID=410659 RepID=A0A1J5QFS1_9ZZZZ